MSHHTKLDENIEGDDNFLGWKHIISLFLEENELDTYISGEVPVPKGDEAKSLHKKNLVKAKTMIVDSITLYHKCLPLIHLRICYIP